jgi:crotonobetainyl-CoA:carnitine CoA-transferase CaiB-like acyl-CoA transferase
MSEPSAPVFNGVRVIELAQFVFVPVAGALMADWGADVVKIEHPVSGDGYRGLASMGILKVSDSGVNQSMELANRGKRSVGLDVRSDEGRGLLLKMVESADVFLTNFLPSTLRSLRLDVDDLRAVNPEIIYARGHGFGVRGPDADQPAYDATAFWARGGLGETLSPAGF